MVARNDGETLSPAPPSSLRGRAAAEAIQIFAATAEKKELDCFVGFASSQ
jgi:hypothetical protein